MKNDPESSVPRAAAGWLPGVAALLAALAAAPAAAVSIEVHDLDCIAKEDNSVVFADVAGVRLGDSVRLYFRRLHSLTEDFYYVPMTSISEGRYLAVLPKPRDRKLERLELEDAAADAEATAWARWWQEKDASTDRDPNDDLDEARIDREASVGGAAEPRQRAWMHSMAGESLQEWLESLANEPAEYYVAVVDPAGELRGRTEFQRTEVTPECPELDAERVRQALPESWRRDLEAAEVDLLGAAVLGRTRVLTVGETAPWQRGERIFHWKCDGIETRIDSEGVYRPDEVCRACVFIVPLWLVGLTSAAGTSGVIELVEPPRASPTTP